MGFDNECILNIQSLAGEYFCPVCRLLVYPNEAIQSQCTHLYCKPCLTYVAGTTRACPYDGYLVTEADSKPLVQSNKALAEAIDKVAVHCLFHRSGCTWQGPLSDCTPHCSGCTFGNYPVACNRCGIQIVHRQVQEHAQKCPGVPSQTQQTDISQTAVTAASTQDTNQKQVVGQVAAVPSQSQISQPTVATPALVSAQQVNPQVQTIAAVVPTQGQMLQQHQQYPGYDPFQQQHYYPHPQQAVQQYQQQPPGQAISYPTQPQAQPPALPQPQINVQASMPAPLQNHQINPPHQVYHAVHPQAQVTSQSLPPSHGNAPLQTLPQPYPMLSHSQQVSQIPQYQQPHAQMHQSLPQVHLQPQSQSQSQPHPFSQPLPQSQPQLQHHSQPQPQLHPFQPNQPQLHPFQPNQPPPNMQHQSAHAVSGHQSYQQPQPPQHSMAMHAQVGTNQQPQLPHQMQSHYPQHHAQMPPTQYHSSFPNQQPPTMLPNPSQGTAPSAQQPLHTPHQTGHPIYQPLVGQPPSSVPNHFHQHSGFNQPQLHMQSQLRPQAPFPPQHPSAHPHSSHQTVLSHSTQATQSHNHVARPMLPNPGMQSQSLGGNQQSATPSYPIKASNQSQASEEQLGQHISQPLTGRDKSSEKTADRQEVKLVENVNDEREKKEQLIKNIDKSVGNVGEDQKNVAIAPLAQVEKHSKIKESQGQAENSQERRNSHTDNDIIVQPKNAQTEKGGSSTLTTGGGTSSSPKGKILPKSHAPRVHGIDEGIGLPPPPNQRAAAVPFLNHGVHHRPLPSNYGPLPSMLHTGSPVPTQLVQGPGFHAPQMRPDDPRYLGNAGQPLIRHDFLQPLGMGPGHSGPSQRASEFRRGAPQEFYGHRMGPAHAGGPMNAYHGPLGDPLMGALPHHPHGGMMPRGANHDHEHSMGQQHFNRELHLLDPLKRDPMIFNSGLQAPMPRLNRPPGPEPLFRSSYIQDRGFYNGNTFDNPRKRKQPPIGWCRICKVDCETMEGLENHCQVREHQDRAMDMVRYIKQNSSKTKMMAANDYPGGEDTRKSKGIMLENRMNRY